MTKHKWHKEIKAWADGAEIQYKICGDGGYVWHDDHNPTWRTEDYVQYRIKPENIIHKAYVNFYSTGFGFKVYQNKNEALAVSATNPDYIKTICINETIESLNEPL